MENFQSFEVAADKGQLLFDFLSGFEQASEEADIESIRKTLPELFPEQQLDVLKAEQRFQIGKGILFTNGTGTGKTFVGLGVSKRFVIKGKRNILIVVPTDKKAKDWILEANGLGLDIYQLYDTNDARPGIIVTTYSNFYQNKSLFHLIFDLVIYDECHYLLQNAQGDFTEALRKHKIISNLPSRFDTEYRDEIRNSCMTIDNSIEPKLNRELFEKRYNSRLREYLQRTKVLFLSASPFAYHKSIMLGDGTLWDIYEKPFYEEDTFHSYNSADHYEQFFIENFGYRMRYNKLTSPDAGVDIGLMERSFYEKFKKQGIISGRKIEVDKDYSREFVAINSHIGQKIDEGKSLFHSEEFRDKYPLLSKYHQKKFNYNYTNQLLECIKAKEVLPRIQQHLDLGRKVIIFHSYNNSLPSHPFKFHAHQLITNSEEYINLEALESDIERFEDEYKELVNLDLSNLINARATITKAFPEAFEYNGNVSKTKRLEYIEKFNNNKSQRDILLVQTKAGKEGISLHDKIGNKQRVLITLGLPTAPTDAIQIEGRIYRIGLHSNAIYEYITLQTNFERFAFAEKIATRSRTAENLAMGEKARNLETVFKQGYLNANNNLPSIYQGTGGKSADMQFEVISEFEKSKTYYFGQGKKTSKNKSKEGNDYFATPEPLGYKMVQWLNLQPNDSLLEPSAGHGAIGRFFPENTRNTFIEPSYTLSSKLAMNTNGEIKPIRFEDLSIWNKFEGIVMNPPFGSGGKLAMEHIKKATRHLSLNKRSRIIAIIPNGPSMHKRLEAFLESEDSKGISLKAEILLPSVVFERAGTKIHTKIIILENSDNVHGLRQSDFSHIAKIGEFFDAIEEVNF
ncbi:MAG: DEAD/DEAH box helicase [Bacteroidota bacterium]